MFTNLKVRIKLIILISAAALCMCIMGFISMNGMEQSYQQSISSMKNVLYDDYDTQIKGQVNNVITLFIQNTRTAYIQRKRPKSSPQT